MLSEKGWINKQKEEQFIEWRIDRKEGREEKRPTWRDLTRAGLEERKVGERIQPLLCVVWYLDLLFTVDSLWSRLFGWGFVAFGFCLEYWVYGLKYVVYGRCLQMSATKRDYFEQGVTRETTMCEESSKRDKSTENWAATRSDWSRYQQIDILYILLSEMCVCVC